MRTTKTRRLRLALALVAAMAMVLPAVPASAEKVIVSVPNETCSIAGSADVVEQQSLAEVPVNGPQQGEFNFGATLTCDGFKKDKANKYNIRAWGTTTDILHGNLGVGETIEQAGTVKVFKPDRGTWEYKTASIVAVGNDTTDHNIEGRFQFVRVGVVVLAGGVLRKYDEPAKHADPGPDGGTSYDKDGNPVSPPKDFYEDKKDPDDPDHGDFRWFNAVATAIPLDQDPPPVDLPPDEVQVFGAAFIYENGNPNVVLCAKQGTPNNQNLCDTPALLPKV